MFKQDKGITLVALVITIIVLLILAGVSISLVVGDNGVMSRAQNASDNTKYSQIKEAVGLALSDIQSEYWAKYAESAVTGMGDYFNEKKLSDALYSNGYTLASAVATNANAVRVSNASNMLNKYVAPTSGNPVAGTNYAVYYVYVNNTKSDYVQITLQMGSTGVKANYGTALNKTDANVTVW
jgi:hypothetical protein